MPQHVSRYVVLLALRILRLDLHQSRAITEPPARGLAGLTRLQQSAMNRGMLVWEVLSAFVASRNCRYSSVQGGREEKR
jgi:hypothetical protein